jgi:hypothetical protein
MSKIILVLLLATITNLSRGKGTNICEDLLAKENIVKDEFATAVAHITHSLYLEPLRSVFLHGKTKTDTDPLIV